MRQARRVKKIRAKAASELPSSCPKSRLSLLLISILNYNTVLDNGYTSSTYLLPKVYEFRGRSLAVARFSTGVFPRLR